MSRSARWNYTLMPDKLSLKFKYHHEVNISSDANGAFTYLYYGNGLYDPDATAWLGDYPTYFVGWSNFYNEYVVHGSRWSWRVNLRAAGNPANNAWCELYSYPALQNNLPANIGGILPTRIATLPKVKKRTLSLTFPSPDSYKFAKQYCSTKVLFGFKDIMDEKLQVGEMGTTSNGGNNPSDRWYWVIWGYTYNNATYGIRLVTDMTFYVTMFNPNLGQT